MIACLPMYDFAHLRAAHDQFWTLIRAELGFGPAQLTRDPDIWAQWQSADLVVGQTCGMPYRERLHDKVSYVLTPDYGIEGCPAGYYNSLILSDDADRDLMSYDQGRFAYNDALSQSGWAGPVTYLTRHGIRPAVGVETGAHVQSMWAVREGRADFCAVDANTYALALVEYPELASLHIIARTDPTPALPYICATRFDAARVAAAVQNAFTSLEQNQKSQMRLRGFISLSTDEYLSVPSPTSPDKLFS